MSEPRDPQLALIIYLAPVVLLLGCETNRGYVSGGSDLQYQADGLEMNVNYLTEPELDRRFSGKYNPFIAPRLAITPRDFLVFEFDVVSAQTEYHVRMSRANLEFGGSVDEPDNAFQFTSFWNGISWVEDMSSLERRRFFSLIDSYVVGDDFTTGNKTIGFIVFRGQFPDSGTARLSIPVRNTETGEVSVLSQRWQFEFREYGR